VVAALGLPACGAATSSGPTAAPLDFAEAPLLTMPTASGALTLTLRASPQPPVRGSDAAEMTFTDGSGAPVAGLAVTVLPWMTAHGHGTSVQPTVTETDPGVFVVTPLYLYMSGAWDLQTTVAGAINDTVTPTLDIP
jgi:hypothetical protein